MSVTNPSAAGAASGQIDRPTSLAGDVYEAIFAQLMSLKIAPGARITVDSLVREFRHRQLPGHEPVDSDRR